MMNLKPSDQKFLDMLKKRNILAPTLERPLIAYMKKWNVCAYRATVDSRLIDESNLANISAEEFGFERIFHLAQHAFPKDIHKILAFPIARKWNCIPTLMTVDSGNLVFVTYNPIDDDLRAEIEPLLPPEARFGVAEYKEIQDALHIVYPISCQMPNLTDES